MPPSSGELWGHHLMPSQVKVDCLLPTGILISLRCTRDATLESIKIELWREAKKYPLFYLLSEAQSYIFVSITQDAEKEEFYDETRRLCDLRLFQPILKVVEPKGNKKEKMLNSEIGLAIGMSVNEFSEMKDLEVMTFRRNILNVCQVVVEEREKGGAHARAIYVYPPDIELTEEVPPHLKEKLNGMGGKLIICIWVVSASRERQKYTIKVNHDATPEQVISEAIRKKTRSMHMSPDQQQQCIMEYTDSYLLKICGCHEFLLTTDYISRYKYIRECIARSRIPQLMLVSRDGIYSTLPENKFTMPSYVMRGMSALQDINNREAASLWDVDGQLRIKLTCATYVNVRELGKIYVKTGVYHGTEPLCPLKDTAQVDPSNPKWNEWLEYDLYIPDIPRSARLCFSICSVSKKGKKKVHYALAWGNINLFDFNSRLQSDKISLHLWPIPQGLDELLNPIGTPGSNPNTESPCLDMEFDKQNVPLCYPPDDQINQFMKHVDNQKNDVSGYATIHGSSQDMKLLEELTERDSLYEISEQDKEFLWKMRRCCYKIPDSLAKLLAAVKWSSREEVVQLYSLLRDWPSVSLETGLELLDCTYTDLKIREFAVQSLEKTLTDDKLSQYLLQLVQVLKFEPYLDNPLTQFLLRRSLLNQKVGHFFFWHLKSEMHQVSIKPRFGLILEAYCRGCGAYLKQLIRQVEALDKLTKLTDSLKLEKDDDQKKLLLQQVAQPDYTDALQNIQSPLNNSHLLGEITKNCKVMRSKKRPLFLTWNNPDSMADECPYNDYRIIFKNGDDLRQDMLTLQVIRIMDNIWKSEGLDLRMIPYGCLATGKCVGMIEVVRNSTTIMKIQKKQAKMAAIQLDSRQLHKWIKEKNNKSIGMYDAAIDAFTRSCAGYCVATFVLGIGDRHPDNIMVNEEGQVFHIDFGHFLDHRKKKFGINRERVPFVLTEDFLHVISKGAANPTNSKEFDQFMELCGKAYIYLKSHANLFITLFTMMLSCGIPELQSPDDIGYLRKTLSVEKEDDKALEYFQQQLSEAYDGAWTTKLDWFFHWVKNR